MRRIWSVLLPLSLMACSQNPVWREDLVLQVENSELNVESATVEGVRGGVVVSGVYAAPGSGYTLRAYYHHEGESGEVVLAVNAYPPDAPSLGVISGHAYRVSIPLPAGAHTVRVVHYDQRSEGPTRNVATGQVTVTRT